MTVPPQEPAGVPKPGGFTAKSKNEADVVLAKLDQTPEIISDMIELAADASAIVDFGNDHFHSEAGRLTRHAADAIVIEFQELCERLSDDFKDRHQGVPWHQIRGMRNRIGHRYRANDYRIIWNAIENDLPAVIDEIRSGA